MNRTLRLARREYAAQVRTKGFLIGLALAPLLACGGLIVFILMKDRVDVDDQVLAVVDRSGLIGEHLVEQARLRNEADIFDEESGKQVKPAFVIKLEEPHNESPESQRLELSDRVRARELYAFLEISDGVLHPEEEGTTARFAYHSDSPLSEDMKRWLWRPLNSRLHELRAAESGFDLDEVKRITGSIGVESLGLVSVDEVTGEVTDARHTNEAEAVFIPMGMMMLLFIMIMFGAMPLLGSTLEEKTRKISEILLGSVPPSVLMAGKLIGGVAVSLTSLTFYVVVGFLVTRYTGVSDMIPFHLFPWLVTFLLAAIVMFGALIAAVGAACNDQSETQSLMPFVMIPVAIPMFVWFPVVKEPLGDFATWLSLFPPFTPVLMLLRMSTPAGVPAWQPWVGLVGVLCAAVFCVWAGGRIFRVGILMQGQAPRIDTLVRWVFRG